MKKRLPLHEELIPTLLSFPRPPKDLHQVHFSVRSLTVWTYQALGAQIWE